MKFLEHRHHTGVPIMSRLSVITLSAFMLLGCGAETATTAATVGAAKKQEIEQGKQTLQQVQQKMGESMQQMQQSPQRAAD
jgi:PBP1b-binding outer membrane lipoprotein LpoB